MISKKEKEKLREILEKNQVVLAYLFGSAARGKMGPLSDIDVAVLFSEKIKEDDYFDKGLHLSSVIVSLFKIEKADVVNLRTVHAPVLKQNIIVTGEPVLVKDKKLQLQVERKIIQEYEDTKYLRKVANEIMRNQIKEGTFGRPLISSYRR